MRKNKNHEALKKRLQRGWLLAPFSLIMLTSCGAPTTNISSPNGGEEKNLTPPSGYNPAFQCSGEDPLNPSTIQRISKNHFRESIRDFIKKLPTTQINTIMTEIEIVLNQWPDDSEGEFSRMDKRVTSAHVIGHLDVAVQLAEKLVASDTRINGLVSICGSTATKASLTTDACLDKFISYYGRKIFRRPITNDEALKFKNYFKSFSGNDAIFAVLARMFSHPNFYYILDNTGPVLSGDIGKNAVHELTKYELLSKITFLFWSAPPDDDLYTFVEPLDLSSDKGLELILDKVLSDTRSKSGILSFYAEWLKLNKIIPGFASKSPNFLKLVEGENVGSSTYSHQRQMYEEILDMAEFHTFIQKGKYDDLMLSPYSFAKKEELARIYGVKVWNGNPLDLQKFPSEQKRAGLIGRAALLANDGEYTRPIMKGLEVRTQLLCDVIPSAPPNVVIRPVIQDSFTLTSEAVAKATASDTCMACHASINPLGFVSESFDSLGRHREKELKFENGTIANSIPVDTKVPANIYPGDNTEVDNVADMAAHIVNTGKGHSCMVRKYFRFAHGRNEDLENDGCQLEGLRQKLTSKDGSLLSMFKEIVKQPHFRQRKIQ